MLHWIVNYPVWAALAVIVVTLAVVGVFLRPTYDWLEHPERHRRAAAQGLLIASSERSYDGTPAREQIFIVYLEHRLELLRQGILRDHPEATALSAERLLNHWIARVPESELVALLVERAHSMEDPTAREREPHKHRYMHLVR